MVRDSAPSGRADGLQAAWKLSGLRAPCTRSRRAVIWNPEQGRSRAVLPGQSQRARGLHMRLGPVRHLVRHAKKTRGGQNSIRFSEEKQYFALIARKSDSGERIRVCKPWIAQMLEKMLAIVDFDRVVWKRQSLAKVKPQVHASARSMLMQPSLRFGP